MDLPAADDAQPVLQHIAVASDPWPGGFTLWRSEDGSTFEAVRAVNRRATIGETRTLLGPGPLWRFDRSSTFDVEIASGTLQSVPALQVLNGANLVAVEALGGWEILSYAQATLVAPNWWRLSGLLRGLGGSEPFAALPKAVGARVVMLDGGVLPLASGLEWLNRAVRYRLAPEGRDHADPMAVAFDVTAGTATLKPLAPVSLKARREAGGVRISWIRRTRFGGDNWELSEVPLNEESEAYQIEILGGAAVKRAFTEATASLFYTASQENADFGGPQTSLSMRILQISASAGPGHAAEQSVPVV
jgi:hypothetical protein